MKKFKLYPVLMLLFSFNAWDARGMNNHKNGHSLRCMKTSGVEISGVFWSKSNVDATQPTGLAPTPADYGSFFQFNRNTAWNNGTALQRWSTATWGTGIWQAGTWNNIDDTGSAWQASANDPCPAGWRLPTQTEFQILINSGSVWTSVGNVTGRCFGPGADTDCSNANALFFPPPDSATSPVEHSVVPAQTGITGAVPPVVEPKRWV
jgi:hypothetical protein